MTEDNNKPRPALPALKVAPPQSASQLARIIFQAPDPEAVIHSLPTQSLHMAIKSIGLESAKELIEAVAPDQYRVLLDFEFWDKDIFNEENFWDWLSVIDEEDSLAPLERFVSVFDRRLIALILQRHVEVDILEEPTEVPPGTGWYTPDRGFTWLRLKPVDEQQHKLLGRFLALIYDQNPGFFYQLINVPASATSVELEEEAYQERRRRLLDEGMPDEEVAAGVHQPLRADDVLPLLRGEGKREIVEYRQIVTPIVYQAGELEPLSSLFYGLLRAADPERWEEFQRELTLIANAGIVFYSIPVHEDEELAFFLGCVRGALNIGLEEAMHISSKDAYAVYEALGLRKLYKLGLGVIRDAQRAAQGIPEQALAAAVDDQAAFSVAASLRELFPVLPKFFRANGEFEQVDGQLVAGHKAFEHLGEAAAVKAFIRERFGM